MISDAWHSRTAKKKIFVETGLRHLPRYRWNLAVDLLSGQVPMPSRWLTRPQKTFLALDPDVVPEGAVYAGGRELVAAVVGLCDQVIPALIEDYLSRHAVPDRLERESLRRGRGPAAVRDAIFRTCASWPSDDLERLEWPVRSAVDEALHETLASRRARLHPVRTPARASDFATDVEAGVHAFAQRRRLTNQEEGWLLSEVYNQLVRNIDRGWLPQDIARWTTKTASVKFNSRGSIDHPNPSQPAPSTASGAEDADLATVVLASSLVRAGNRLAERAADLRAIGDVDNAAIHDVSAMILIKESVDGVTAFLEGDDSASAILAGRLHERGFNSPSRRLAAVELIKATLRDALTYS